MADMQLVVHRSRLRIAGGAAGAGGEPPKPPYEWLKDAPKDKVALKLLCMYTFTIL